VTFCRRQWQERQRASVERRPGRVLRTHLEVVRAAQLFEPGQNVDDGGEALDRPSSILWITRQIDE
jgi:hypothetical protein